MLLQIKQKKMTMILFPLWPASFYEKSEISYNKNRCVRKGKQSSRTQGMATVRTCSCESSAALSFQEAKEKRKYDQLCVLIRTKEGSHVRCFDSLMCVFHALPVTSGSMAAWWQLHSQNLMYQCSVNICHMSAGKETSSLGEVTFPSTSSQEKFLT